MTGTTTPRFNLDEKDVKQVADQIKNLEIEEEHDLENQELDLDSILEESENKENYDVFEDLINPLIKRGVAVVWTLKKDQEVRISSSKKMFSWAKVHEKFGEGDYQVRPRNKTTGQWLKSQSLTLGEFDGDVSESSSDSGNLNINSILENNRKDREFEREERRREREELMAEFKAREEKIMEQMKSGGSTIELMSMMMTQQTEQRRIADEQRREDEKVRREEQIRLDDLRREERKEEERRRREEKEETERIRREEKAESEARFEKILLTIGEKKDDGVSLKEHLKELEEAKEKARKDERRLQAEIERKAEELSASKGSGEESITDKAVKGVLDALPHLTKALSKDKTPVQVAQKQVALNPTRRQVRRKSITSNTTSVPSGYTIQGLEDDTKENVQSTDSGKEQLIKAQVEDIVSPVILSSLMMEEGFLSCYQKSCESLTAKGIDTRLLSKLFSKEQIIELFAKNGLIEVAKDSNKEEQLLTWIDGYYEEFVKSN